MTGHEPGAYVLAVVMVAILLWHYVPAAFRALDVWSAANVDHLVSAALDPVDVHFDSLPGWVAAPTFADLRADWPAWEQEVSA